MLTVGSLFSGIGGLDLGLERAGMRIVWQVEIDDYGTKVLEKHWPHVQRFRDVRECGAHNLEPVDLICGGFPCQPHSLTGKRRGSADERDLWPEFARIIRELGPRWVLAENVLGILSSEAGRYFGRILRELAESGYDAEWDCIPAVALGAPHIRKRLFIVAYSAGIRREAFDLQHRLLSESGIQQTSAWSGGGIRRGASGRLRMLPLIGVDRVGDGLSARVDGVRCLGNAVVPQVAEFVGRRIVEAELRQRRQSDLEQRLRRDNREDAC